MSSIANQTNEINTGQYTQYSATLPGTTATKLYEATQDCQIIVDAGGNTYWKLNAPASSSDYDFLTQGTDVCINNVSIFNTNIKEIAHRKTGSNNLPYFQLDLQKGDSLYGYNASANARTVAYYVRNN